MRFIIHAAALCLILALILPAAALAQYEEDGPTKLNVRLGLFRPFDNEAQLNTGKTWSSIGLNYDLKTNEQGRPILQAELGLMDSTDTDDKVITLGANKLWWQKPTGTSLYYGAGLGLAKFTILEEKKLTLTGQLLVGFSVSDNYFVELRGLIVPSMDLLGAKVKMSGVVLSVGTRKLF